MGYGNIKYHDRYKGNPKQSMGEEMGEGINLLASLHVHDLVPNVQCVHKKTEVCQFFEQGYIFQEQKKRR
jgi:hypothetical protein